MISRSRSRPSASAFPRGPPPLAMEPGTPRARPPRGREAEEGVGTVNARRVAAETRRPTAAGRHVGFGGGVEGNLDRLEAPPLRDGGLHGLAKGVEAAPLRSDDGDQDTPRRSARAAGSMVNPAFSAASIMLSAITTGAPVSTIWSAGRGSASAPSHPQPPHHRARKSPPCPRTASDGHLLLGRAGGEAVGAGTSRAPRARWT